MRYIGKPGGPFERGAEDDDHAQERVDGQTEAERQRHGAVRLPEFARVFPSAFVGGQADRVALRGDLARADEGQGPLREDGADQIDRSDGRVHRRTHQHQARIAHERHDGEGTEDFEQDQHAERVQALFADAVDEGAEAGGRTRGGHGPHSGGAKRMHDGVRGEGRDQVEDVGPPERPRGRSWRRGFVCGQVVGSGVLHGRMAGSR